MHNRDDNLQEKVVGRLDNHMWKNKIGPLSHTIFKINSKLFKALQFKNLNCKTSVKKWRNFCVLDMAL